MSAVGGVEAVFEAVDEETVSVLCPGNAFVRLPPVLSTVFDVVGVRASVEVDETVEKVEEVVVEEVTVCERIISTTKAVSLNAHGRGRSQSRRRR